MSDKYKTSDSYGAELQKECIEVFFGILKIYKEKYFDDAYFEKYGFDKDIPTSLEELEAKLAAGNRSHAMADLVLFETNKNVTDDWQMQIHQDVMFWWGGGGHMFNFNIYINDDYEGGEITFYNHKTAKTAKYIDSYSGNEGEAVMVEDVFTYKMQAGDGLIFPVDVQHGVLPIKADGEKYYIRQFLTADNSDEYKAIHASFNGDEAAFEEHFKKSKKEADLLRETPFIFDSLDSIDLDSPKYSHIMEKKVPFVAASFKDLSFLKDYEVSCDKNFYDPNSGK
jgi:hypothetical protein